MYFLPVYMNKITLKTGLNAKHKFNANSKHNFFYTTNSVDSLTYSVQKPFVSTVFQNDDNSSIWWQSCASL